MRVFAGAPLLLLLIGGFFVASPNPLQIYLIDVEGGNATLVVSPSGQSLLMDSGNLSAARRDAERILEAVKDARLQAIDHLVTTHWHLDHFGGMSELAARVPIREFIDHGANIQPKPQVDEFLQVTYPQLYRNAKHVVATPGDIISLVSAEVRVVASAGATIDAALPGAGASNPYCLSSNTARIDQGENSQSIGLVITYGKFRALHLGDLSADKELQLMCPDNRIGTVDLFIVSHHGQPNSNTESLVNAIEARAAIMNNGIQKGGEPEVMKILFAAPGLENLWQLHFSQLSGPEYTVPGLFVANLSDHSDRSVHNGRAHWIKVSAEADGSFTIVNGRNGFSKQYRSRAN
jgi:competence protein ComEC